MVDFEEAMKLAHDTKQGAVHVVDYLSNVRDLLRACDEAEDASEELNVNGETVVQMPLSAWEAIKEAYTRAW